MPAQEDFAIVGPKTKFRTAGIVSLILAAALSDKLLVRTFRPTGVKSDWEKSKVTLKITQS